MDIDEDVSSICESTVSVAQNAHRIHWFAYAHISYGANINECLLIFSKPKRNLTNVNVCIFHSCRCRKVAAYPFAWMEPKIGHWQK